MALARPGARPAASARALDRGQGALHWGADRDGVAAREEGGEPRATLPCGCGSSASANRLGDRNLVGKGSWDLSRGGGRRVLEC